MYLCSYIHTYLHMQSCSYTYLLNGKRAVQKEIKAMLSCEYKCATEQWFFIEFSLI